MKRARRPQPSLAERVFCFSGFRDKELQDLIITAGGTIVSSVTKAVTDVVCKSGDHNTKKVTDATAKGLNIVTREDLEFQLKDDTHTTPPAKKPAQDSPTPLPTVILDLVAAEMLPGGSVVVKGADAYDVQLSKVEGRNKVTTFLCLQLVFVRKKGRKAQSFNLFSRTGQIGTAGDAEILASFLSLDDATLEFENVFRSKTGNDWKSRSFFVRKRGKFNLEGSYPVQVDTSGRRGRSAVGTFPPPVTSLPPLTKREKTVLSPDPALVVTSSISSETTRDFEAALRDALERINVIAAERDAAVEERDAALVKNNVLEEFKARIKFCNDLQSKDSDLVSSFFDRVKALNFTPKIYSDGDLEKYIGNNSTRESSNHAERLRVKYEKSGSQRSWNLSEFRPKNLTGTKYEMQVQTMTLKNESIKDILRSLLFQSDEEITNIFLNKWAHFIGELREIIIFQISQVRGGIPEFEVSFTQPLVLLLLRSIAADLKLDLNIEVDGVKRSVNLGLDLNEVKLTGVLDLARTHSDENIMHHHEVKRSHTALASIEAMDTREQLTGQNLLLSLCLNKKKIIRGLCTDIFVSSTCWYQPEETGYGGVQYVEMRILEPISFVLRLVLSLLDLEDQQLRSIMEVKPSEDALCEDGYEEKDDQWIDLRPPLADPRCRNQKFPSQQFPESGGGATEQEQSGSIVLWCGRDASESYMSELCALKNFSRILQGEVPLTLESLERNENQMQETFVSMDPVKKMMLANNRKVLGVLDRNLNR